MRFFFIFFAFFFQWILRIFFSCTLFRGRELCLSDESSSVASFSFTAFRNLTFDYLGFLSPTASVTKMLDPSDLKLLVAVHLKIWST